MQPSFADCTITPWIRSLSDMLDFSAANMVEVPDGAPPVRQAFSLTGKVSPSVWLPPLARGRQLPSSSAWRAMPALSVYPDASRTGSCRCRHRSSGLPKPLSRRAAHLPSLHRKRSAAQSAPACKTSDSFLAPWLPRMRISFSNCSSICQPKRPTVHCRRMVRQAHHEGY